MEIGNVFVNQQRVYWDQLDLLGVLHNGVYPVLFERARTAFWGSLGITGYEDPHMDFPYYVVQNTVNYKQPITTEQDIAISVWIAKLGRTSLTFGHQIRDEANQLVAEGNTTIVRVDSHSRQPIPWSNSFCEMIHPYIARSE